MSRTTIQELAEYGQSIWLDYISRALIAEGLLEQGIHQGLRGITSNPTIFHQAISQSRDYDEKILGLGEQNKSPLEIYDVLTVADIQDAADIFRSVYEATDYLDGYVSLEINPKLAAQAAPSIEEGVRLFQKVNRPNVMIKVPATVEGFVVIEELLARGINVNVTLIFSQEQYWHAAWAYFKGLERLSKQRADLSSVRSVASVFVSRIDTAIDKLLMDRIAANPDIQAQGRLKALKGKAAVANSRLIFKKFQDMFSSEMFATLAHKGAAVQRVLWASTGTKSAEYSDCKYVTELICRPSVNTLPEKTLQAFLDHGEAKEALSDTVDAAEVIRELKDYAIDLDPICRKLLQEGLAAFEQSFDALVDAIGVKTRQLCLRK